MTCQKDFVTTFALVAPRLRTVADRAYAAVADEDDGFALPFGKRTGKFARAHVANLLSRDSLFAQQIAPATPRPREALQRCNHSLDPLATPAESA